MRSKPQSFGGWKECVKSECESDDIQGLENGHKLWKIRKKKVLGITCHLRKYMLNFSDLCIYYEYRHKRKVIDIANITEVRAGFSTDTWNEVEKRLQKYRKIKVGQFSADVRKFGAENCFSIIFDHKFTGVKLSGTIFKSGFL